MTKKVSTQETPCKSGRGGKRPGAGRKPKEGKPFTDTLLVRVSAEQKAAFAQLGGADWIRSILRSEVLPRGFFRPDTHASPQALPQFSAAVACGFPTPAFDCAAPEIDLNKALVRSPDSTFFAEAIGDSMVDAGIASGDLLVIDRGIEARSGDIVLARVNDEFTVKRLRMSSSGPVLEPENQAAGYPSVPLAEGDDFEVLGVVLHAIHRLHRG